jgi:hypothetical protein
MRAMSDRGALARAIAARSQTRFIEIAREREEAPGRHRRRRAPGRQQGRWAEKERKQLIGLMPQAKRSRERPLLACSVGYCIVPSSDVGLKTVSFVSTLYREGSAEPALSRAHSARARPSSSKVRITPSRFTGLEEAPKTPPAPRCTQIVKRMIPIIAKALSGLP